YTLPDPQLTPRLKKGQVVGSFYFLVNGKSFDHRPLVVMEGVEEGGFFSRMWEFLLIKFHGCFGRCFR
ncbi:serine-type D-Ala-D-Ala carboxypeptidase, partial [Enterobacter hormaechei]